MRHAILILILLVFTFINAEIPSEMMEFMDTNVHPCDDFYQYSCGGWLKNHELKPSDIQIDSTFGVIRRRNLKVMKEIVQENHPLMKELWSSCMAFDKTTERGNKPLERDLIRIAKATKITEVLKLAGEFTRTGTKAFSTLVVSPDVNDATFYSFHLRAADMTLPSMEFYEGALFESISSEYHGYINELIKLSGFSRSKKRKRNDDKTMADIIIRIEQDVLEFKKEVEEDILVMEIGDAMEQWPVMIGAYLNGLGLFQVSSIKKDFKVYIDHSTYFDMMEEWITSISLDDLKTYLAFIMVHSRVQWLGEDFARTRYKFFGSKLVGQQRRSAQNTFCVNRMLEYFPDLIGKYYYKKQFDREREEMTLNMINFIKNVMEEHISSSTWLDVKTKNAANTKLNKIITLIGQPEEFKSYSFDLSPDDYPSNIFIILSHSFDAELKKIGQRVNRKHWELSAAKANAYYSPYQNAVIFPAGVLQPPFFNGAKVHPARNFGAVGSVMGHELTHGFDTVGRYFDGDGNQRGWWSESMSGAFEIRANHIVEQYSTFKVHGEHGLYIGTVNGNLTISENIADNGGVALAWDAYHKYMKVIKPETDHVDDDKGDQLFFLSYAQSLCKKSRDEKMKKHLVKDPHSPSQWRVNGVVMNNKDFAKVFKCNQNAPMNPIKKYQIW